MMIDLNEAFDEWDAWADTLLEKNPRWTISDLILHLDFAEGIWLSRETEGKSGTQDVIFEDSIACSFDPHVIAVKFEEWLKQKWELYVKNREKRGEHKPKSHRHGCWGSFLSRFIIEEKWFAKLFGEMPFEPPHAPPRRMKGKNLMGWEV